MNRIASFERANLTRNMEMRASHKRDEYRVVSILFMVAPPGDRSFPILRRSLRLTDVISHGFENVFSILPAQSHRHLLL